jgi:hypothetical protein
VVRCTLLLAYHSTSCGVTLLIQIHVWGSSPPSPSAFGVNIDPSGFPDSGSTADRATMGFYSPASSIIVFVHQSLCTGTVTWFNQKKIERFVIESNYGQSGSRFDVRRGVATVVDCDLQSIIDTVSQSASRSLFSYCLGEGTTKSKRYVTSLALCIS